MIDCCIRETRMTTPTQPAAKVKIPGKVSCVF